MRSLRSWRGVAGLAMLVVVGMFLVRPGANRLRARIVESISLALGRQVDVSSVNLRLLPRPGFDLENFVVHDDPAFGAEPMLRAQEVTASLRVTSLLRGRLEIAHLSLTEPSLNLVRNAAGHWNLENLLERADKIPIAPTSKPKTETRPGFPYIESSHGRINFKFGPEKKPYALTEADFGLWQDSENAWGVRLKAQPVRTDVNLSDSGTIRVDGSWQRASTLRDTPVQFSLQWEGGQLGQLTKLVSGNDKGWRGTVKLAVGLTGTPANLALETAASVEDFRRHDILGGGDLLVAAQCQGQYSSIDNQLVHFACQTPVDDGKIIVDGNIVNLFEARSYNVSMLVRNVPIQSLVALARHAKQGLPDDLVAAGRLDASFNFRREAEGKPSVWEGGGETAGFRLASNSSIAELELDRIPFALSSPELQPSTHPADGKRKLAPEENRLDVGPFDVVLGKAEPARIQGWVSRSGYGFAIQGDAQIQRLLQLARMSGISSFKTTAEGSAKVDLQVAGIWAGFMAPATTGKVQLHSIRADVIGLNAPLEIAGAKLTLTPDQVEVENLVSRVAGTSWNGTLGLPRKCLVPGGCPIRFNLHADEIATDQLNSLLNPYAPKQPWYRFLSSARTGTPYLLTVNAEGKFTADRVRVRKLSGNRFSANVELKNGSLQLSDLRAEVLGGNHTGEWKADFTTKPPQYSGSGRLEHVTLGQLAQSMKDDWITGTANATYRATASGLNAKELFASAAGTLEVEAREGLLPHLVLGDGTGPVQMRRLAAHLILRDGKFEVQQGDLQTPAATYHLSGTASLSRVLDLKLTRDGAAGFNITGTLTEPRVLPMAAPETQLALKP